TVQAFDATLGANADVVVRQRPFLLPGAGRRVLERLRATLLVEMQRVHLVLAIEAGHQLVRARELEDFDFADDQRVIGGACRESMARDSRKERERGARAQVRKEVSTSH